MSEQRIDNGCLELILNLYDSITFHAVKSIQVHVKRTNEVPGTHKYIGPVPLEPSFQVLSQTEVLLTPSFSSLNQFGNYILKTFSGTLVLVKVVLLDL